MLERDARIESGADEIVNELLGRSKVQRRARIVLTLPAEQITQDTAETLHVALRRYCEARLARVQREIEVAWRQGLRSLGSGSILFIVGLLLSTGFLEPDIPRFWQDLLGNGVFLVIGWVGLWYPLDLLFFARQPLKREALIVEAISRMPLLVQPPIVGEASGPAIGRAARLHPHGAAGTGRRGHRHGSRHGPRSGRVRR